VGSTPSLCQSHERLGVGEQDFGMGTEVGRPGLSTDAIGDEGLSPPDTLSLGLAAWVRCHRATLRTQLPIGFPGTWYGQSGQ